MKNYLKFLLAVFLFHCVFPYFVRAEDQADPFAEFDSAFTATPEDNAEKNEQAPSPDETLKVVPEKTANPTDKTTDSIKPADSAPLSITKTEESAPQKSGTLADNIRLEGSLRNETAYRVRGHGQFNKIRNQAILVQSAAVNDDLQFKATERGYYDAVFDLTDNYPDNVRDDADHELEFRDTYLDYSSGDFDIRLGKQQIVWGESLGLFFADVVNAKDLREFILPDFDMIRIPEWGADVEYSRNDLHVELVYIPYPEMDKVGVQNSDYEFKLPIPDDIAFTELGADEPSNNFKNSEYASRISYLTDGWDIGAFYLYTWDKFPIYFRSFDSSSNSLIIQPDFRRQHIAGLTFSKEVAPVVLKGEAVVNPDSSFSTADINDTDGVVRKTYVDYILGADMKFFDSVDTNFQFMERVIFNHEDTLINNQDAVRNYISFWAKTTFMNESLEPEFLILSSVMRIDLLLRPSLRYKFADHWDWKLGVDYFEGSSRQLFGQFEIGSRAYTELTYRF